MLLKHVALACSSEEKSDKFYRDLLGLKKINSKILPRELSKQIFNLDFEFKIVNYADDNIHLEIFIGKKERFENRKDDNKIEHICIEIEALEAFLERCRDREIDILQIRKGDRPITFIRDYDDNLFEIKAKV